RQCFAFFLLIQVIGMPLKRHPVYLRETYQAVRPPERASAFDISRNEKDSNRNLQFGCKRKCMCVVVIIPIVKREHQERASSLYLASVLHIEFFQRRFEVKYTVVTAQVEQLAAQIFPNSAMVIKNNQVTIRVLYPPAHQVYESTVVEKCRNTFFDSIVHKL